MIRFYQVLIIIFSVLLFSCQSEKSDSIDWKSIDIPVKASDKRSLLLSIGDSLINGIVREFPDSTILELFHLLDLNDDGSTDVIFNGYGGAAEEFTLIYLRDSVGWIKVLQEYGHVRSLAPGHDAELQLLRKELVGEQSGDSIINFKIRGLKVVGRMAEAK